jgi:hypothetical protein
MAQVDWYIEGVEFSNCNCDYGCPCRFESRRPTHGDCLGFAAVRIDKGQIFLVMNSSFFGCDRVVCEPFLTRIMGSAEE